MVCELCRKNPATVHLTQIVEQAVTHLELCEPCARTAGVHDPTGATLGSLFASLKPRPEGEPPEHPPT